MGNSKNFFVIDESDLKEHKGTAEAASLVKAARITKKDAERLASSKPGSGPIVLKENCSLFSDVPASLLAEMKEGVVLFASRDNATGKTTKLLGIPFWLLVAIVAVVAVAVVAATVTFFVLDGIFCHFSLTCAAATFIATLL